MSKRAEEAALKAYPEDWVAGYFDDPDEVTDDNTEAREYFQQGYEQAEKDLALTGEDARLMVAAFFYVIENHTRSQTLVDQSDLYEEVLKRFNEQGKK